MRRRQFIALLGSTAVAWPVMSQAQQQARLRTVGFLGAGTPATAGVWISAFTARLPELGWMEDRNVKIDLRWAEGRPDRSAEIATIRPGKGRCHCHVFERTRSDRKGGDINDPNRLRDGGRSGRLGPSWQLGASGRQSNRNVVPKR
jgi:hypothetical protein